MHNKKGWRAEWTFHLWKLVLSGGLNFFNQDIIVILGYSQSIYKRNPSSHNVLVQMDFLEINNNYDASMDITTLPNYINFACLMSLLFHYLKFIWLLSNSNLISCKDQILKVKILVIKFYKRFWLLQPQHLYAQILNCFKLTKR